MNTTALKVVLDTNILVASIGRRSPYRWIFDAIIAGKIKLCLSNEILLEYEEILALKTSPTVAENVVNFLIISPHTIHTDIFFNFGLIIADTDDNKFVDCAISANADLLLTNDRHFDSLKTLDFPRIFVISLNEFESKYKDRING